MCRTESAATGALRRIGLVMNRLGLKPHPEKTRMGRLETRKGELCVSGLLDSKEVEQTAEPSLVL
jgi:hypothetical protein